jgi:hypothetical protein
MDVIAHALEVTPARTIHDERLVAAGEQVAEQLVPPVEADGLGAQQPFHPRDQIRLRCLDDPMKMIGHEDIGVNLPACRGASLAQRLDEALVIRVIDEDRLAPVASIHDVVHRAGILDSELACHAGRAAIAASCVNIKNGLL